MSGIDPISLANVFSVLLSSLEKRCQSILYCNDYFMTWLSTCVWTLKLVIKYFKDFWRHWKPNCFGLQDVSENQIQPGDWNLKHRDVGTSHTFQTGYWTHKILNIQGCFSGMSETWIINIDSHRERVWNVRQGNWHCLKKHVVLGDFWSASQERDGLPVECQVRLMLHGGSNIIKEETQLCGEGEPSNLVHWNDSLHLRAEETVCQIMEMAGGRE